VRRWQAAKRQQQRRQRPEARAAHAAAERKRRARQRVAGAGPKVRPGDQDVPPQAKPDEGPGAWSRSKKPSAPFCDRPGCYDAVRASCRCQARYCGDECRRAVKRVRDRERKWLNRQQQGARFPRSSEYPPGRSARRARAPTARVGEGRLRTSDRVVGRQL
jgi:hypothetical protein